MFVTAAKCMTNPTAIVNFGLLSNTYVLSRFIFQISHSHNMRITAMIFTINDHVEPKNAFLKFRIDSV